MNDTTVTEIGDAAILDVPTEPLTADVTIPGTVTGGRAGTVYAVAHHGSLHMITLRYRFKGLAVRAAKTAFEVNGVEFPAGSFLIEAGGSQAGRIRKDIESLGLTAAALATPPAVESIEVDLPRIAVYSSWSSTEKVGWVRLAFDRFEVPFELIYKDQAKRGRLRAKYDVIVVPHQGRDGRSLVHEAPRASRPLPYRKNDRFKTFGMYGETDDVRGGMGLEGAAEFEKFVEDGGLLMTLGVSSYFPAEFGIARAVYAERPPAAFYAPGPLVRAEILQPQHPVFFGYTAPTLPVRWSGGPLLYMSGAGDSDDQPGRERAAALMRFPGGDANVLSGLMRGADQIRNRPAIVDAPVGQGRVLLYAINPIYRWQNFGEHNLVFNALLFYNDLPPVPSATAQSSDAR